MKLKLHARKGMACAALLMTAAMINAQSIPALNADDYTVPAWTKICRTMQSMSQTMQKSTMPYSINMTVNGNPATRMAFAWFTNTSVAEGEVQLVAKAVATEADFQNPDKTIKATSTDVKGLNYSIAKNNLEGIPANMKKSYRSHKALAEGLQPGTTYSYRVGNSNGWSEIGHFTTAPGTKNEKYSFIYITDTQAQYDEMFDVSQKTVHAAKAMVPDAAFVLCNGDLVETSGSANSEWEYEQWFSTMQDVWLNTPLVVAQGNHDKSSNSNFAHHFNTDGRYNQTATVKTAMDGTVYSFVRGDVLFMVINYEDWNTPGYFNALADWMRQQVRENSDVKWRVATYHKNMFTGSMSHQDDSDGKAVREAMLPVFTELNINLALQGHDHIYEVMGPVNNASKQLLADKVEQVETITGGKRENMTGKQGGVFHVGDGTLYFLNNSAGRKKYEPRNEQEMINSIGRHGVENYWGLFSGKFGQTGEPTFSKVDVDGNTIHIATYTVDGEGNASLFDSFDVVNDNAQADGVNGVNENNNNVKITVNGEKNVIVTGIEPDSVEVYSTDGAIMMSAAYGKQISLAGQAKGMYLVKATSGNNMYYSKVMVD